MIGQALGEVKGQLSEFGEAIGAVLVWEALEKGVELIKEFGSEVLKAAAGEERTQKSFTLNFGVEGGKEALEYAEKFSEATEFTEDQAKGFLEPLLKAGVPLKDMDKYMAAAGDAASGFQNKLEGMQVAVSALSRAELGGKISGREARQLNIGVPQLKQLDEYKGMSDKQLRGILEKGSLTKEQLFRVMAGSDGVLGDKAVEMGQTMGAKLAKLGSLPERLFQEFYKAPAFDDLKGKIDDILKAFDPKSAGGQAVIKGLGDVGMSLVHMFDGVKIEDVVKNVTKAIETIPPIVKDLASVVGWFIENWDGLKTAFEIIVAPVKAVWWVLDKLGDGVAAIITSFILFPGQVEDLAVAFGETLWGAISSVVDIGAKLYDSAVNLAGNLWQGLKDGISAGVTFVEDAISDLGNSMIGKLKDVLGIHSPSAIFEEMGAMTGEGFNIGIKKSGTDDVMKGAFAVPAPSGGRSLAAGGGGGISISIPVTVSAHPGQSAEETGKEIGEKIRDIVLPMLINALEQAGAEAGA